MLKRVYEFINRRKWNAYSKECRTNDAHTFAEPGYKIVGKQYIHLGDGFLAGKNLRLQAWSISGGGY